MDEWFVCPHCYACLFVLRKLWVLVACLLIICFVLVLRTCSKSLGSAIVSSTTTRLVEGSIFDTLSLSEQHCLRFYISTISSHFFSYFFMYCRYLRSIVLVFSSLQFHHIFFLFLDTLSLSEEHCLSFLHLGKIHLRFFLIYYN